MKGSIVTNQQNLVGPHFTFEVADKTTKAHRRHFERGQHAMKNTRSQLEGAYQIDPSMPAIILDFNGLPFHAPGVS
jgi:hypothetical protein